MKFFKKMMIFFFAAILLIVLAVVVFMQQAVFGKNPSGETLEIIKKSPNYRNGVFQNVEATEVMRKEASTVKIMLDFFNKPDNTVPDQALRSVKTDLVNLDAAQPTIVWFGHSSYLIKQNDFTILVDPVFSGYASPVSFFGKAFPLTYEYTAEDIPAIDLLILTHDHYDHLDYETILKIHPRVKQIITPLGVDEHLKYWQVPAEKIATLDWWEQKQIGDSIQLIATPSRHFSGRGFARAKTQWASFVLKLNNYNIFIGGDSGYDSQFKKIGDSYGPFDIVMLETGQYGVDWPLIHMLPEEVALAAKDLQAKKVLPVHWAKFALAYHAWNDPIDRLLKKAAQEQVEVTTPMIGEPVVLGSNYPITTWWR